MRLAQTVGIEVPFHCMIYAQDGSLSYIIRRFDRFGHGKKLAVEDFAQLSEHSRETKYNSSMNVAALIDRFCTFPLLEKLKLLRLTLFSFLIGNEDMHLKNFSLLTKENKITLSPAYDLLNSTIVLKTNEELALPVMGKRSKLTNKILFDYFAIKCLGLSPRSITDEQQRFFNVIPIWEEILASSFLSAPMQTKYIYLVHERMDRLRISAFA